MGASGTPLEENNPDTKIIYSKKDDNNENPLDERFLGKKLKVQSVFEQAIIDLDAQKFTKFCGFVHKDSNLRGENLGGKIKFNEKFLNLDEEEVQRWGWHEIQHTLTQREHLQEGLDPENQLLLYLFVLHPSLVDLHTRMLNKYEEYKNKGFPFCRPLLPIPDKFADVKDGSDDYFSPLELLSLLKGYECYLRQTKSGNKLHTDPSEFIEAFKPQDLELLDPKYRITLGKWVVANNPEVTNPKRTVIKRTETGVEIAEK
jgi:hypothetical protein